MGDREWKREKRRKRRMDLYRRRESMVDYLIMNQDEVNHREKEMEIRIEGKTTKDIWRNLKECVDKCVIRKQDKKKEDKRE